MCIVKSMATQSSSRNSIKKEFQKSFDNNLTEYTQETTIHGLKYLGRRNRSLPERIFWITIFIVSSTCLGYFVYKICKAWMEHPIMITARNTPTQIFQIPFPAVTVCPAIKLKQDKFNVLNLSDELEKLANISTFWSSDYGTKYIIASQICRRSFQKYTEPLLDAVDKNLRVLFNNVTIHPGSIRALYDFSPQLDETIKSCRISNWNWDDKSKYIKSHENCKSLFSTIITNEGVCFTFNTVRDVLRSDSLHKDFNYYEIEQERDGWDPDEGYTKDKAYPYKGMVKGSYIEGAPSGFKFVLIGDLLDTSPHCEPLNLGYKLVLNSPTAYPHMYEKYISLEYGKEYKIAIKPKTIYTADDLRSFDPETRQCYFNDERHLKYFTFYNEVNCRLECYANFSLKTCGGAPFSSPHDANITICLLHRRNYGWDLPQFYGLLNEYNKHFTVPKHILDAKSITNCNCLPECNSIQYDYEILKSYDDVGETEHFRETNSTDIVRTTVEILFSDPYYIGEKRVRVYTFETLISDFGGLLGLFMGGSLLSFFELIYFLTIRNCFEQKP